MTTRTALLKKCLKELLEPQLAAESFVYDRKYTFRSINATGQTVRIIEFQLGIKSALGKFTVNLGVYSPLYSYALKDYSPPSLDRAGSVDCLLRERLGCIRETIWSKFWSTIFGKRDKWWKDILYGPRDLWWPYSEDSEVTITSLNKCGALISGVGLNWLQKNDDLEAMKRIYDGIKARTSK